MEIVLEIALIVIFLALAALVFGALFLAVSFRSPKPWNLLKVYAIALTLFSFTVPFHQLMEGPIRRHDFAQLWMQFVGAAISIVSAAALRNRAMLYLERRKETQSTDLRSWKSHD